jgi:hypothetical protein
MKHYQGPPYEIYFWLFERGVSQSPAVAASCVVLLMIGFLYLERQHEDTLYHNIIQAIRFRRVINLSSGMRVFGMPTGTKYRLRASWCTDFWN